MLDFITLLHRVRGSEEVSTLDEIQHEFSELRGEMKNIKE